MNDRVNLDTLSGGLTFVDRPFPPVLQPVGMPPQINGFTPRVATTGSTVTIFGMNFLDGVENRPMVFFRGAQANNLLRITDAQIDVVVPDAALDGPITVSTRFGAVASADTFIVAPKFVRNPSFGNNQFNPTAGEPDVPQIARDGARVTIFGTGLAGCTVSFAGGNAPARLIETAPFFVVFVPGYAMDGPITLRKPGAPDAVSEDRFDVRRPPIVTSVSPMKGAVGDEVVIGGLRFGANNGLLSAVTFTGMGMRVPAPINDTRNTNQIIYTRVPAGAVSGSIRVRRSDEDDPGISPQPFVVVPVAASNLSARAEGTSIALAWIDNSGDEAGFKVERRSGNTQFSVIARLGPASTTYIDASVAAGVGYTYRIKAFNADDVNSRPSNEASAVAPGGTSMLAAPADLRAVAAGAMNDLSWIDNSDNEVGFKVERRQGGSAYAVVAVVGANVTSYQDRAVAIDLPYTYRVKAFDAMRESAPSNEASTTPAVPAGLAAPRNLSARPVLASQIDLTWSDDSFNEDGFIVERAAPGLAFAPIASVSFNTTRYSDFAASPGITYGYRVKAFNATQQSAYSNVVTAGTMPPGEIAPNAPSGLTAKGAQSSIRLDWFDNSAVESSFVVERKAGAAGFHSVIALLGANATSFVDGDVVSGIAYSYRVRARNANGDSPVSNEAAAMLEVGGGGSGGGGGSIVPAAPSNLIATGESFAISLTWSDASSDETGFKLERQTGSGVWSQLAVLPPGSTGYFDSPLSPFVTYAYRVCASNAAGDSAYSNVASARPLRLVAGV